jgi:DNA (cytosine-5)-methyltransferase 1
LAEIEPFPSAVLAHHYPDVPNLGDMTALPERILSGEIEAPDLFCGGTPCQAFSVAGLRNSLDDARGNLSLTFVGIANAIDHVRSVRRDDPAIIFWENVPGVLSTKDNAFGCFLGALAGEDDPIIPSGEKWTNAGCVYGPQRAVAWRVLDAQYFGVAQRRRRVFVVASARDDFDPAAVLLEFDGVRRDSAPSRKAWQNSAPSAGSGLAGGIDYEGNRHTADEPTGPLLKGSPTGSGHPLPAIITMANGQGCAEIGFDRGQTLTCNHEAPIAAYALQHAQIGRKDSAGPQGKGWQADLAFTQDSRSCADAVAIVPAQPIGFNARQDPDSWQGRAGPLDTDGGTQAVAQAFMAPAEVGPCMGSSGPPYSRTGNERVEAEALACTTTPPMAVRRLTPVECERLQGFPDNYTAIPWKTAQEAKRKGVIYESLLAERGMTLRGPTIEDCPDGPRYKALGNSWAVPVVRWIGKRIQEAIQ